MKTLLIAAFTGLVFSASAQTQFISKGRVVYERKINQHKPLEDEIENAWYKEMLKAYPKFVNDTYELYFDTKHSMYKLAKEVPENRYLAMKPSETEGVIQDLAAGTTSTKRDVFENNYVIQDSLRNLEWRITDETREIAGFECRKAVTKICDSVYVVAFYTDQINVSSGPETFGGLPGMILGLAVPRLYTTWFATKVELIEPTTAQLNPVQKGKKTTWAQMNAELKKAFKDRGSRVDRMMWTLSL